MSTGCNVFELDSYVYVYIYRYRYRYKYRLHTYIHTYIYIHRGEKGGLACALVVRFSGVHASAALVLGCEPSFNFTFGSEVTKPSPSGATSQRRLCLQVPIEMQRFPQFTGSLGQLLGFAMPSTPCPSTVSNTRTATEAPKVQRPICADPRSMAAAAGSPSKPQRAPLYPRFFSFSLGQKGPVTNHRPLPVRSLRHAQLAQSRQGFSTSPGKTRDRQQQVVSGRSDHAILTSTGVLVFWAFLLECKCKPASCWLACLQPLGFLFEEVSIADRGCLGETPVWKECCTTKRKLHYIANSLAFFSLTLSRLEAQLTGPVPAAQNFN